jgi:sucrose 6(F)-phosphate phosphorylase
VADPVPPLPTGLRANRPQLLTYPDSLGGTLAGVTALLRGPLDGLFSSVHILPPFPSTGDRGFAPVTYDRIDPRFGDWGDVQDLARTHGVLLDVMVNHISRRSPEFEAFARDGLAASTSDLFITPDKVWPAGDAPAGDIARLFLRRSTGPFSTFTTEGGERVTVWTTFGEGELSEQIDLDLASPAGRALVERWLAGLAAHGVSMVRLDAVGYVIKQAGTSCFMVEPGIWSFLDWASETAARHGLTLLPEIHHEQETHRKLTAHGLWTYDFVLPGLVLHALTMRETRRLAAHLAAAPDRVVTTLDCHDGIPVRPDLEGILAPAEMRTLAHLAVAAGGNINRIISASHAADGVDVHQLNIAYFSALGLDEDRYLAARAIQLFARGIPQLYYVGLLAGANDDAAVAATGEGRSINRHDYTPTEIEAALARPIVQRLLELVRLRNSHEAFDGTLTVTSDDRTIRMAWANGGAAAALEVDVRTGKARVGWTAERGWEETAA